MIAAAVLAAAAIATGAVVAQTGHTSQQDAAAGRLVGGDPVSVGQPAPVGRRYSAGLLWLTNRGSSPVSLDRVSLVRSDEAIKVVGAYVQRDNKHSVGFNKGYATRWGEPFKHAEVAPGMTIQIVIGLVISRSGEHRFRAVDVSYHTSSGPTTTRFPVAIRMCAPAARYMERCNAPTPLMD